VGYPALLLSAWQGQHLMLGDLLPWVAQDARDRGDTITLTAAALSAAVLHNSLGGYGAAVESAADAARSEHLGLTGWALMELVEAAARAGHPRTPEEAAARLAERTGAAGTDWALGSYATARALLAGDEAAEPLYQEAVDRLARTGIRLQLARAQLLYGEWLRRRNRRVDARIQLHAARDLFATIGATTFANRAHRELLAAGESARRRTVDGKRRLTPQESRVAYLARDGLSNPEIGAQMFVSPRTVEYHLHKVFAKLAITSRTELHLVLQPATAGTRAERSRGAERVDGPM
jgi:DNA-binding CsgD family transcriptional regulator